MKYVCTFVLTEINIYRSFQGRKIEAHRSDCFKFLLFLYALNAIACLSFQNNSLLLNTPEVRTPEPSVKKEPPPPLPTSSDEEESKPMSRWIDNYEEATCNYYAPELRARIASIKLNGSHQDVKLPASLLSTTVQKCRASLLSSGTKVSAFKKKKKK